MKTLPPHVLAKGFTNWKDYMAWLRGKRKGLRKVPYPNPNWKKDSIRHTRYKELGFKNVTRGKQNPIARFRDLSIGDKFEFDHRGLPLGSGIATGPWVKISPRTYQYVDPTHEVRKEREYAKIYGYQFKGLRPIRIGSINAKVVKLNPIAIYNPEMRPRIKVTKSKRRGRLGERSPLKGFKINPGIINRATKKQGILLPLSNIEIRYRRANGKHRGEHFKHNYGRNVKAFGLPGGSILLKSSDGKKLWGET